MREFTDAKIDVIFLSDSDENILTEIILQSNPDVILPGDDNEDEWLD